MFLLLGCYGKIVIVTCRKTNAAYGKIASHCLAHSFSFALISNILRSAAGLCSSGIWYASKTRALSCAVFRMCLFTIRSSFLYEIYVPRRHLFHRILRSLDNPQSACNLMLLTQKHILKSCSPHPTVARSTPFEREDPHNNRDGYHAT